MTDTHKPPSGDETTPAPGSGHSILDEIGKRAGRTIRTSLNDSDAEDTTPVHDPRAAGYQEHLRRADRAKYNVVGEIASGGMGVVLRGHDTELGRDVAMKVVHEQLADRPEVLERFVEEAQIGGQLQHPGIVPVYELGLLADDRPYFTMKLVKGHTLAKLLSHRESVDEDRVRFLKIFEAVCQTVAYAHSKGVVHRDLKPANVMVGSFGEVQVVDWGLSKVLRRGGSADERRRRDSALSMIETVRSGPETGSGSMVGNVLGTPDYMSPEQARGEIDGLDERTDVFALGAILCEILTGAAPYIESKDESLVEQAAMAELDGARERIDATGAADALKKLCHKCLMPSRSARPASAERVAAAIHAHLDGLETSAHEAQLAAAEQRVAAERSRRRLQLAASAAAVLVVVAGGFFWTQSQRVKRMAELERGFADARELALERTREGSYEQAMDAARTGLTLLEAGDADTALLERARALVADTEAERERAAAEAAEAERERAFLAFLEDAALRTVDVRLLKRRDAMDEEYRAAFTAYGLDLDDPSLADRIEVLRDTPRALDVARGVDGWANVLREAPLGREDQIDVLTSIALDLDPDPLRARMRLAVGENDVEAIREIALAAPLDDMQPESFTLLVFALLGHGELDRARWMAAQGADRHPSEFLLQFWAGTLLFDKNPWNQKLDTQSWTIGGSYLRAAVALRPEQPTPHLLLGDYYRSRGQYVLARRATREAVRLTTDLQWNWGTAGFNEYMLGNDIEAQALAERDEATGTLEHWQESALYRARVNNGDLTIEESIELARKQSANYPEALAGPGLSLLSARSVGRVDPERALELVRPLLERDLDSYVVWLVAATSYVLLGDGEKALAATERLEGLTDLYDMVQRMDVRLLFAAAHRLLGDDVRADKELKLALHARDDLFAGHEDEWAKSPVVEAIEMLLPIAEGR
ncbi:MAG: protein kinase [Planctomycetota bacterium]